MSYEALARRIVFCGGNLAQTAAWLHDRPLPNCPSLDEQALRALLYDPAFRELLGDVHDALCQQQAELQQARQNVARVPVSYPRVSELDAAGRRLLSELKNDLADQPQQAKRFKLWMAVENLAVKLSAQSAPGIGTICEAELLVKALGNVFRRELPSDQMKKIVKAIEKSYAELLSAYEREGSVVRSS